MNLLDKFSAVDIKAETRISNSDKQFCEVQQAAYNHGRNALKQILDISERFIKEQNDILGAIDREVYSNYIYDGREGISLHIENMDVSYDQVLDQIFVQLGGFSFHDKAINEMKEKCHEAAWNRYYGKRVYEQKKSVLSFTGYGCSFDSWHEQWHKGEYEIKLTDGMKEIIRALAYFEYGEIGYIPYAFNCLLGWSWTTTETERRFDMEKLKSIKCFKNGRVDIRFTSEAYARQFAEEFLGTEAY